MDWAFLWFRPRPGGGGGGGGGGGLRRSSLREISPGRSGGGAKKEV